MPLKAALIRHVQWPLMELVKGNRIRTYMRELASAQYLPASEIASLQKANLYKLLAAAVNHVPAYEPYREAFAREAAPEHADAFLLRIPPLSKQAFNRQRESYLSREADPTRLIENRTGGSTGEPTRIYLDRCAVEHYEAARWLGLSWHGIRIGDPCVMIWGSPLELSSAQSRRFRWKERTLKNRIIIPAYDLSESRLEEHLRKLRSFRPAYLYGYASALALFAELMLRRGLSPGVPLKAVVSTAETLHPGQREQISRAFQCPVVNEYGARDGGIIAYECPAGRMHLFSLNAWVEVVDFQTKQPVPPGEKGLLLVTDLHNFSMPRLRYQLGDVAALSAESCPCGIQFPLLASLEGREDDIFVSRDGRYIHGHYFNHIARNLDGIETFQLVQHAPDRLTLSVVRREGANADEDVAVMLAGIREALGDDIDIEVHFLSSIPPSPSGKRRYAVRNFPLH